MGAIGQESVREDPGQVEASRGWLTGRHPLMRKLRDSIQLHARGILPVMILGEPGTGKERVAKAIHELSGRSANPFVAVSLPASSETLIESELFGHEEGAFTGAVARRIGRLEQAGIGTVFLDEVGDASTQIQIKLLRAMDPGEFTRVGGCDVLLMKARVVAATNAPLDALRRSGRLREDFLGRLTGIRLLVPPLRDRLSDLPDLTLALLKEHAEKTGRPARRVSGSGLRLLERHAWPSNVRELRQVLWQCASWVEKEEVDSSDIERAMDTCAEQPSGGSVDEAQRIREALIQEKGVILRAARRLGMGRSTLYEKLSRYGIDA